MNRWFLDETKLNFCSDIWKENDYDEKQKQKPIEEEEQEQEHEDSDNSSNSDSFFESGNFFN